MSDIRFLRNQVRLKLPIKSDIREYPTVSNSAVLTGESIDENLYKVKQFMSLCGCPAW